VRFQHIELTPTFLWTCFPHWACGSDQDPDVLPSLPVPPCHPLRARRWWRLRAHAQSAGLFASREQRRDVTESGFLKDRSFADCWRTIVDRNQARDARRQALMARLPASVVQEHRRAQTWIQHGGEPVDRVVSEIDGELQRQRRRDELCVALANRGLELRADSRICDAYIAGGHNGTPGPSLAHVVQIVDDAAFLYRHTSYPQRMRRAMEQRRERLRDYDHEYDSGDDDDESEEEDDQPVWSVEQERRHCQMEALQPVAAVDGPHRQRAAHLLARVVDRGSLLAV